MQEMAKKLLDIHMIFEGISCKFSEATCADYQSKRLKNKVNKIHSQLKQPAPAMKAVSIELDKWVHQNIESEGGLVGGWPSFYADNPRLKKDPSAKLLRDTGRLNSSFLPFSSKDNAGIGSDLPYSKPHDSGTDSLPQRRLLPKWVEVGDAVHRIMQRFLDKVLK